MYCDFYQMTERPFNVTPDPRCLYLNARYREALAALQYGITQRKGFITLIGEAGTGKTTLLKRLLEDFDQKTRSVFIFNTHVSFEEILEYLFAEFDLPVHNGKKLYMLQRLNTFLLEELRGGGNVALLIDEAQDLDYSVLEDLRLLSNLETAKEKILQIVLSGQPELGEKLSNPILRQLRQRIAVSCRLLPLSREEISEYIQYRLHAVGCTDLKLFSRDAEDQIYHFSRGIPRIINVVCDNALVIGYALGKKRIGGDTVAEAAADLMPAQEPAAFESPPDVAPAIAAMPQGATPVGPRARIGLVAVVLVAIIIGLLSVGRSMLQRQPASGRAASDAAPAGGRSIEVIRPGSLAARADPVRPKPVEEGVTHPQEVPPVRAADPPGLPPAKSEAPAPSAPAAAPMAEGAAGAVPPSADAGSEGRVVKAEPAAAEPAAVVARAVAPGMPAAPPPAPLWAEPEAARAPEPAPPALQDDEDQMRLATSQFERVKVQRGDSISRIALRKYGQAGLTILDLLKLANPDLHDVNVIAVGQTIQLPDLSESSVVTFGERRYGVLVYSTMQPGRAAALESALRARGYRSRVSKGRFGAQRVAFRVVLEGFGDSAAAAAASRDLQRLFRDDGRMALLVR